MPTDPTALPLVAVASNFSWPIDGSIVGLYLLATMAAGLVVRKYVGRVEDFLVAGREMKVYLGIASLAATEFGIITCMYTAQSGYNNGFAGTVPGIAQFLAMLVIGWTGFCIRPLRESGALTIPELFERRFGTFTRWLSGVVIVLGGLLNMGVFLKIGGEFLVVVTRVSFGENTIMIMMGLLLLMVTVYTILGGMLSVLITDFLQFVVMSVGLLVVSALILKNVGWDTIVNAVQAKHGAAAFNPFINPRLGWQYVVFQLLLNTAATLTWQTVIARVLAAKDARTGQRVFTRTSFFFVCRWMIPGLWGMAALATLTPAAIATLSPKMQADPSLYAMPLFLGSFVPIGLMGVLVAAMLAADMSTDSSYMLTWGSVIYNDILAPFRRRTPVSERRGLLINRLIVAAIGVYLFFFGLVYEIEGDVWDYLTLTGAVYLSSMSVLLIACCYWRRANNWGAIGAILLGALVPVTYLTLQKIPATTHFANVTIGPHYSGIAAFAAAALGMIVGSLIKPRSSEPRGFDVLPGRGDT
jgi:SSS family solute:Na+ symporter